MLEAATQSESKHRVFAGSRVSHLQCEALVFILKRIKAYENICAKDEII